MELKMLDRINNIPTEFRFSSGRFTKDQVRNELMSLNSSSVAFGDLLKELPNSYDGNRVTSYIFTDTLTYASNINPLAAKIAQAAFGVSKTNNSVYIYLNPDIYLTDNATGRPWTLGEVMTHELGHGTKKSYKADDGEDIATKWGNKVASEKNLSPFSSSPYDRSQVRYENNEKTKSLFQIDPKCFIAGTKIMLPDGGTTTIEKLNIGQEVASFDQFDTFNNKKTSYVSKIFINTSKTIVDIRGLRCTPGHVFLVGETNANGHGRFDTIARILLDDLALVEHDATLIRARTGAKLGQADDALVGIVFCDPPVDGRQGRERHALVRAGIPLPPVMIKDTLAPAQTLAQHLADHGITLLADGRLRMPDGTIHDACNWPEGTTPFDTHEARNWIVQADGVPYCPPWIRDLVAEDETEGLRVVGTLSA